MQIRYSRSCNYMHIYIYILLYTVMLYILLYIYISIVTVKVVHNVTQLENGFRKTETSLADNKYMNTGDLIFDLPQQTKHLIRQLEQTRKKLTKTKYSLAFNKTCLKEDVLPNYTNIKTHDPAARYQQFTKDYRRKLVEHQVSKQEQTWVSGEPVAPWYVLGLPRSRPRVRCPGCRFRG